MWNRILSHGVHRVILATLLLGSSSCALTRNVRPVGEQCAAAGVSLGGPLFSNLGAPIPVPLTSVYGRYGLDNRTDVDVGLFLPIARTLGLDAGAARLLWEQDGVWPAFMAGARLAGYINANALIRRHDPTTLQPYTFSPRVYEELYGSFSWQLAPEWLGWSGLHLLGQIERATAKPTLYAGVEWRPSPVLGLSAEAKWMALLSDQRNLATDYRGIAGRGALAIQVGASYYFGKVL